MNMFTIFILSIVISISSSFRIVTRFQNSRPITSTITMKSESGSKDRELITIPPKIIMHEDHRLVMASLEEFEIQQHAVSADLLSRVTVLEIQMGLLEQHAASAALLDRFADLETRFAQHQAASALKEKDIKMANYLADVFAYFCDFQLRIEKKRNPGSYSSSFNKIDQGSEIIAALNPRPISIWDDEDEADYKLLIASYNQEAERLVKSVGVAAGTVIDIETTVRMRNADKHLVIDDSHYGNHAYMYQKLKEFLVDVQDLAVGQELFSKKVDLENFTIQMLAFTQKLVVIV